MSARNIADGAPWTSLPLAVLDLEGNGHHPPDLVELAAIQVDDGVAGETRSWLVRPDNKITHRVSQIHGIKNSDVANAPSFASVADDVMSVLAGRYLVAHNAAVDWEVLSRKIPRLRPPAVLDTLRLARALVPGRDSYGLTKLLMAFELQDRLDRVEGQPHRAAYDAFAALQLLLYLISHHSNGQLSARKLCELSELPQSADSRQGRLF